MNLHYNQIQDIGDSYILHKNPDLPSAGTIPFKDIHIEWGTDYDTNRVKIKSMIYPKSKYTLDKVKKIAKDTINCPNCIEGRELHQTLNTQKDIVNRNNKIFKSDSENMKFMGMTIPNIKAQIPAGASMTKFMDPLLNKLGNNSGALSKTLLPQVYSQLLQMGISWGVPEKILQKILFFALGGSLLVGNELWMPKGRLKDEMRTMASNLATAVIDPDAKDIERMQMEANELIGRFRFNDPFKALQLTFASPIDNIKNAIDSAVRSISLGLGGAGNLMLGAPGSGMVFGTKLGTNIGRNIQGVPIRVNLLDKQTSKISERVPKGREIGGFRVNSQFQR